MKRSGGLLEKVLNAKDKFELQVIYTQINRNEQNEPYFKSFSFNVDPERYFYSASTVKMPAAFLALEKLNVLHVEGLNKHTTFLTDSAYSGQSSVTEDTTSANRLPSVAHYIKKIFVVSDNDAYNRLYEFLGQEAINKSLHQKGFINTRLLHRLSIPLSQEQNQHTNPVRFYQSDSLIYSQELVKSSADHSLSRQILKGKAHMDNNDSLIQAPFDFSYKNFIPLGELQDMLKAVLFPGVSDKFKLTEADYSFLYQYMSQLPRETTYPDYSSNEYYDAYCKFLMYGDDKHIPEHIRIFNKIGQAYGYLIDNAYIVDLDKKVEFLLSAVIHVNDNETYNDGNYEYETIGLPFMKALGQAVYTYELTRKRSHQPDLSKFELSYDR
ncbi:serine hydrolase [Fulvivirga sp. M361]|nr:serine hydrolase [Fulvivirga sp. M361]